MAEWEGQGEEIRTQAMLGQPVHSDEGNVLNRGLVDFAHRDLPLLLVRYDINFTNRGTVPRAGDSRAPAEAERRTLDALRTSGDPVVPRQVRGFLVPQVSAWCAGPPAFVRHEGPGGRGRPSPVGAGCVVERLVGGGASVRSVLYGCEEGV